MKSKDYNDGYKDGLDKGIKTIKDILNKCKKEIREYDKVYELSASGSLIELSCVIEHKFNKLLEFKQKKFEDMDDEF